MSIYHIYKYKNTSAMSFLCIQVILLVRQLFPGKSFPLELFVKQATTCNKNFKTQRSLTLSPTRTHTYICLLVVLTPCHSRTENESENGTCAPCCCRSLMYLPARKQYGNAHTYEHAEWRLCSA